MNEKDVKQRIEMLEKASQINISNGSDIRNRLDKLENDAKVDDVMHKIFGISERLIKLEKFDRYDNELFMGLKAKVDKLEDRLSKPISAAQTKEPAISNGIIKAKMYAKMKRRVAELEEDNEKLKIQNEKGKRSLKAATKALSLNQFIDFAYENMVNEQRIEFCKDTMSIK